MFLRSPASDPWRPPAFVVAFGAGDADVLEQSIVEIGQGPPLQPSVVSADQRVQQAAEPVRLEASAGGLRLG